jgi:hypothetical protein
MGLVAFVLGSPAPTSPTCRWSRQHAPSGNGDATVARRVAVESDSRLFIECVVIAGRSRAEDRPGNWVAHAIVDAITVNQATGLATWIDVSLNTRVLAFTALAGLITAVVFGVGPAIWTTRIQPLDAMRQGARSVIASGSRMGITHWLVIGQVAVAFSLVPAARWGRELLNLTAAGSGSPAINSSSRRFFNRS